MKQVIIIMGMSVIVIIVSLTLFSIESKNSRQEELDRAVSAAVKQTVKASQIDNQKEIATDKELVAEFVQLLSQNMHSESELSIEVMDTDYKNGMLDVLVTEKVKYLNGRDEIISVRKCAIYE